MISAKMICDSIDPRGNRLRTLEVVMPRYILAEFNTHRMLSRNSASSRAIPFDKMVNEVQERTFIPYAWQKNHKGMQGTEYHTDFTYNHAAEQGWLRARDTAVFEANLLNNNCDITKQLANRLLEPFMYHKVLVSGTEWDNFFNLRCPSYTFHNDNKEFTFKSRKDVIKHFGEDEEVEYESGNVKLKDLSVIQWLQLNTGQADIHMMFLAEAIWDATNESVPVKLKEGEWHVPYGDKIDKEILKLLTKENWNSVVLSNAVDLMIRKISVARCARLSYQTLGDNPVIDYEADLKLYDVLAKSGHYSPFEHVARVMTNQEYELFVKGTLEWTGGQYDKPLPTQGSDGWCLNFKGFIQERYLLEQEWKS